MRNPEPVKNKNGGSHNERYPELVLSYRDGREKRQTQWLSRPKDVNSIY